ncbi:uncharacterized protein LOC143458731 [Clavelina lepadiformis]|uniref:uncharacterized protein LOC143458731 n=1 Tax=Clavelina lepadiformis TaxID=159417 RepID=UPI004040F6DF
MLNCTASYTKCLILARAACKPISWNQVLPASHRIRYNSSDAKSSIRIGCASGFWGDTSTSTQQLVHQGDIDVLVSDYLSEITMSLLTGAKRKNPTLGYAPDFVSFAIAPQIKEIKKRNIQVLSNAGGTNPEACAKALQEAAKQAGTTLDVAVVSGDDMMPNFPDLLKSGKTEEMYSRQPLPKSVMSMNAYFGAEPIRRALDMGAEVVITGRCVDSALVLAPLMHKFKWTIDDYDRLAAGSLAGHLLECGAQSTGGVFTDWQTVPAWENIGFPIAECYQDGTFCVTKPPNTGGLVTPATVAEQLVYEIGDPSTYMLPDVTCDFTNVKMTQHAADSVLVTGAKGYAPTKDFKVCATYLDGFRTTVVFSIGGKRAIAKGRRTAESIIKRVRAVFSHLGLADFRRVHIQAFGDESLFGENARTYGINGDGPRETVVWMAVEHDDKKALEILSREIAAAGTGMAPGLSGIVGGRPKVSPVLKLFSFLHAKQDIPASVTYNDKKVDIQHQVPAGSSETKVQQETSNDHIRSGAHSFILEDLAYTRSGDKGNSANIGVVARDPSYVRYLRKHLTAEAVYSYFKHLFPSDVDGMPVQRFELPGIDGFNFLMKDCLGGGGVASLRTDPQGKALGQMLLDFEIKNVPNLPELTK